jgi:hypothetical protein
MIIDNLDKIVGLVGILSGIEILAAIIFTISFIYLRNPQVAGIIGNISSLSMTLGLITLFLKKD